MRVHGLEKTYKYHFMWVLQGLVLAWCVLRKTNPQVSCSQMHNDTSKTCSFAFNTAQKTESRMRIAFNSKVHKDI